MIFKPIVDSAVSIHPKSHFGTRNDIISGHYTYRCPSSSDRSHRQASHSFSD